MGMMCEDCVMRVVFEVEKVVEWCGSDGWL